MRVVLLKDIPGIGKKDEVKEVSRGYGLNFLIPRGFAISGTPERIKGAGERARRASGEKELRHTLLVKNIEKLKGARVKIAAKANKEGHLFAAISQNDIARAIQEELRLEVDPALITTAEPIKRVGEHPVSVSGGDKTVTITVLVEAATV